MTDAAAADREALLAEIDPYRESIESNQANRDRLYEARAELFRRIRAEAPDLPLSKLAERAGISVPAVIQQIAKAEERRSAAEAEAAG